MLDYLGLAKEAIFGNMPIYLMLFVTSQCNAKCVHCWYWRKAQSKEQLTLDEIEKISKNFERLLFLNLAGGEPFLRDDLPAIARLFSKNCKVKNIATSTNGLLTNKIVKDTKKMIESCQETFFSVNVSIDGIKEKHDKIRQVKGLFEKACDTFKRLQRLEERYENFSVGLSITASYFNQDSLLETYFFARDVLQAKRIDVFFVRGAPRNEKAAELNTEKYRELVAQIASDIKRKRIGYSGFPFASLVNLKNLVMYKEILNIAESKQTLFPCTAGKLIGVIFEDGTVAPCELLNERFGNLRENGCDFKKIWNSERAAKIRKKIRETKCSCTHECFLGMNILFNPKSYPLFLRNYLSGLVG
jgi:MoaA/NifB/PqqE/SkfB family radical SAM enzyme